MMTRRSRRSCQRRRKGAMLSIVQAIRRRISSREGRRPFWLLPGEGEGGERRE